MRAALGVDQRRRGFDCDGLRDSADGEGSIDGGVVVDGQHNIRLNVFLKSGAFDGHGVAAHGQQEQFVRSVRVRLPRLRVVRLNVPDGHQGPGTTPPEESRTAPTMLAVDWAKPGSASKNRPMARHGRSHSHLDTPLAKFPTRAVLIIRYPNQILKRINSP